VAANVLGAELFTCGVPDGELFDAYDRRLALIAIFRMFRPTLVIAHAAENYHPDHRAASALAEAGTWFTASRGHVTKGQDALDAPPALWWADTVDMAGFAPSIYIDVTAYLNTKKRMLAYHRTQLQRGADGDFAPLEGLLAHQCEARGTGGGGGGRGVSTTFGIQTVTSVVNR
jgi:N-acetylglucosamine malate deacetylase 1